MNATSLICMPLLRQLPHFQKSLPEAHAAVEPLFEIARPSNSFFWELSSQRRSSSSRKRHCRPTFSAGISPHSAQKQTVRVEIPSHRATAAVERKGSLCSL